MLGKGKAGLAGAPVISRKAAFAWYALPEPGALFPDRKTERQKYPVPSPG